MKPVLVTGSGGFIGRHLCRCLAQDGIPVRAVIRNRPPLENRLDGVDWVRIGDIASFQNWPELLEGIDQIVHLAAIAHRTGAEEPDWSEYRRVNVEGSRRLAEAAAECRIRRLLFVSSIAAVCSLSEEVIDGTPRPRPDTLYGKSKLLAENAIREVLSPTQTDWIIFRPTVVYGAENPGNMRRLVRLIDSGIPLPVGVSSNRRSLLFVGNLVDAIRRSLADRDGGRRDTFTICDDETVSTLELVEKLALLRGRKLRVLALPLPLLRGIGRLGDLVCHVLGQNVGIDSYSVERLFASLPASSSRFKTELRWSPPYSLDEGLALTFRSPSHVEADVGR